MRSASVEIEAYSRRRQRARNSVCIRCTRPVGGYGWEWRWLRLESWVTDFPLSSGEVEFTQPTSGSACTLSPMAAVIGLTVWSYLAMIYRGHVMRPRARRGDSR